MNKQQQKNLALIGTILIMFLIQYVARLFIDNTAVSPYEERPEPTYIVFVLFYLQIFIFWIYIGFATDKLKEGIIAGVMHFAVMSILGYFSRDLFILSSLIGFATFAYQVKFNNQKIIVLSLLGTIIYIGSSSLYLSYEMFKPVDRLMNIRDFLYGSSFTNLRYLFQVIQYLIPLLFIPFLYSILKNRNLKFNELDLRKLIGVGEATLYFYVFYVAILVSAYNITDLLINHIQYFSKTLFSDVVFIVRIAFTFFFVYLLIWFYRKVLLEFFLIRQKAISWHWYFLQIPIIRSIIWLIINTTDYKGMDASKSSFRIKHSQNTEILTLMVVALLLSLLGSITMLGGMAILSFLVSIVLLFLFAFNKYGLIIMVSLQIALFFILGYMSEHNMIQLPRNVIGRGYFVSLVFSFIQYPLFHLKEFKVLRPQRKEELELSDDEGILGFKNDRLD